MYCSDPICYYDTVILQRDSRSSAKARRRKEKGADPKTWDQRWAENLEDGFEAIMLHQHLARVYHHGTRKQGDAMLLSAMQCSAVQCSTM